MANEAFGERIRMDCDETSHEASARRWTGCRGDLRRLTLPGDSRLRYYTAATGPTVLGHAVPAQLNHFCKGHRRHRGAVPMTLPATLRCSNPIHSREAFSGG